MQISVNIIRIIFKTPNRNIKGFEEPFEGCTAHMVDFGTCELENLDKGKITTEEYFTDSYAEEVFESENVHTSNKRSCTILDSKYKNNI